MMTPCAQLMHYVKWHSHIKHGILKFESLCSARMVLLVLERYQTWRILDIVIEICKGVVVLHFHNSGHLLRCMLEGLQGFRSPYAINRQIRLLCIGAQQILDKCCPAESP